MAPDSEELREAIETALGQEPVANSRQPRGVPALAHPRGVPEPATPIRTDDPDAVPCRLFGELPKLPTCS